MKYFDNYQDVKKLTHPGLRSNFRSIALNGLSLLDKIKGLENDLNKPRVQFLYIHHIFKDEEQRLETLLKRLAINHTFLSYSAAVEKILSGNIDKPYLVLSFDDGFKNNTRAAEILNNYGAKACFFINPSIIGETDYNTIKEHCKKRLGFPPVEFLNWDEVAGLQKMGHEIGSHTMNHINVVNTGSLIIDDCHKSFELIRSKCGEAKHFAFPYGRYFHFNELGRKAVFNSGFISCASAERGCHVNFGEKIANQDLCILRDHVILDRSIDHVFHFMAHNSRVAALKNNFYPYSRI